MNSQLRGSQMADCLNPVKGVRDAQRRAGKKPVDHGRKNALAIRLLQKKNRELKETQSKSPKVEPFKLKQFRNVKSKIKNTSGLVNDNQNDSTKHNNQNEESKPYSATNKNFTKQEIKKDKVQLKSKLRLKEAVPKSTDLNTLAPRLKKNFISSNFKEATQSKTPRPGKSPRLQEAKKHSSFGQVPEYIIKRKLEDVKKAAAIRDVEENGLIPPGMVLMKEADRLNTVQSLKQGIQDTKHEIGSGPLRIETTGQHRRAKALEDKLKEQEAALEIFSKDRVYIYDEPA